MIGFLYHRCRMVFWTSFYHTLGRVQFASLGRSSRFQGWIEMPQRGGRISIGRNAHICSQVEFSVTAGAELIVGDDVFIGRGTLISSHRRVHLGAHVLIAEHVSIHDNNHGRSDATRPIGQQGFTDKPLYVGDGSWIGARCILVKGAGLGRGCVLGAGSVLTRELADYSVATGAPARTRSTRESSDLRPTKHSAFPTEKVVVVPCP